MNKHKITQDGQHIYTINTRGEQTKKTGNTYTQSILGVNKHKITQDGQRIYTINTRREQTQNNSRGATHIHNQYLA